MVGVFSEYCGPDIGIWKGTGIPRDEIDKLCKKHDREYEFYLLEGYDPYTSWNMADENFLKGVKQIWYVNPAVAAGAITWFEFKRAWSILTDTIPEGKSFFILQCSR
jgi:hypothetical protein